MKNNLVFTYLHDVLSNTLEKTVQLVKKPPELNPITTTILNSSKMKCQNQELGWYVWDVGVNAHIPMH
jgi:hypothetical protein